MSLAVGARLGVYEVLGPLGAGGMGEVYRARDTRLQRDVALKILPEAFALDRDRLARFEREARVLASLNHPNIAQIFGLEESSDVRALVMELVPGPTIAAIMQRPTPAGDLAVPIDMAPPCSGRTST
jgi:serine/threonine protein kinase